MLRTKIKKHIDNLKGDKEWFLLNILFLASTLFMIVLSRMYEPGSHYYLKANKALFVAEIIIFFLFIGSTKRIKQILLKILSNPSFKSYHLTDYGNIILVITYLVGIISFFLILDLSFLKDITTQVGVVALITINLVSLVFTLIKQKK